jgi:ribosomal protein S18 acetylase RimI-like enzyme
MLGVSGVSINLGPDDLGARVSVRHRLLSGATDVVGDLEILDAEQLAIRRSDGSLGVIEAASVIAARVVGPSLASAREHEEVSARSWPAPDEEWLGRWWLRSAGGFTARACSVRPLGDPGRPLDDALAHVVGWYAERRLPAMIRVVSGSNVGAELDRRGWESARAAVFQTVTVARLRRLLSARGDVGARSSAVVQTATLPPQSWLLRYEGGAISPFALKVLSGARDVVFATIDAADVTAPAVAIGRAAVEEPWVGFTAIEVDPLMRRQGHANAVMLALTEWAASRGAVRGWLEVLADNRAALALYASLGFTEHHRYTYRSAPET